MKNLTRCERGCPPDNYQKCFCYGPDGRLCQEPATVLGPNGRYICEQHKAQLVRELRREAIGAATLKCSPS